MTTNSAILFSAPSDPSDFKDYKAEFKDLLVAGENISEGFTVIPTPATAAVGISVSASPSPSLEDNSTSIKFWPEVAISNQEDVVFNRRGFPAEFEVTFTTSDSRSYQKTFCIIFKQL